MSDPLFNPHEVLPPWVKTDDDKRLYGALCALPSTTVPQFPSTTAPAFPAPSAPTRDERGMSAADRKNAPVARGVLDYFPDALLEVANLSRIGNEQHNPGQPMHWAREKSTDHADCIIRHLIDRGTLDTDGVRHAAKVAWRALALLQLEIEASRK